jgi:enoyl-CoA hydratase/carnithine racemase
MSFVRSDRDGHVAIISLARPEALNALSGAMCEQVAEAFREAGRDSDIWAIVLRGDGDKAFCVGADLKERAAFTLDDYYANREQIKGLFSAVRNVPQPTVAAVFGFALGGGFELALSCDLIVAAMGTKVGLPEVTVGLLPGGGGTQLLARRVGVGRAKDMILRGLRVDAEDGVRYGAIDHVCEREELESLALELARDICASSPVAARAAKYAVEHGLGHDVEEAISEIEGSAWARVITSEDRQEGIAAFNEKRSPRWQNR